ncbi:unnamed protein product [Porites evermanni]|uniref:Uncharacterized protein n=1 Tax=Porites evermanni TaxID=104178 RepID=A0ABN8MEC0_9CNID|nr:unnamed protein product [Porites evermanni]
MDKFRVAFTRFLAFYSDNPSGLHEGETPAKWQTSSCGCYLLIAKHERSTQACYANVLIIFIWHRTKKFYICSILFLRVSKDNKHCNHNYNKIVKSDWLSTALISALIGQFNRTVRVMPKFSFLLVQ